MAEHNRLGKRGEKIAARYLKRHGCKIIATNLRLPFGEVDILAAEGNTLRFVEVKTRASVAFALPRESVGAERFRKYRQCAEYYVKQNRLFGVSLSIDVIEVVGKEVTHLKNAFD